MFVYLNLYGKFVLPLVLKLVFFSYANAQFLNQSIFFNLDWINNNPAIVEQVFYNYSNESETITQQLVLNYHQQWHGFEDTPKTLNIAYQRYDKSQGSPGIKWGVMGFGDLTSSINSYGIFGNFALNFELFKKNRITHYLGLGLNFGTLWNQMKVSVDDFQVPEIDMVNFEEQWWGHANLGFLYRIGRITQIGVSMPLTFPLNNPLNGQQFREFDIINFTATSQFELLENNSKDITFHPDILIRYFPKRKVNFTNTSFQPLSIDIGGRIKVSNEDSAYWVGGGYSSLSSVLFQLGYLGVLRAPTSSGKDEMKWGVEFGTRIGTLPIFQLGPRTELKLYWAW